jgi:hypothetical protein
MQRLLTFIALVTAATLSLHGPPQATAAEPGQAERPPPPVAIDKAAPERAPLVVSAPVLAGGLFPCSNCHTGMEVDPKRRQLRDDHTDITLQHAGGQLWCLDCHHPSDRDTLQLLTGETLPFTESYRLCGQCHGEKLRDWQRGIHGRRSGYWNSTQETLLCAACHDPHKPAFKALAPMPAPERPGQNRF